MSRSGVEDSYYEEEDGINGNGEERKRRGKKVDEVQNNCFFSLFLPRKLVRNFELYDFR